MTSEVMRERSHIGRSLRRQGGFGRLALASFLMTQAGSLFAADYYCSPDGSGSAYTIDAPGADPNWCARNLAKTSGDVIHLAKGTYVLGQTPNANQQIFLQKGVTLIGATDDPADTVIDGDGKYRAACCYQGSMIRNLTMSNCVTTASLPACSDGLGFGGAVCAQSVESREYVISNCVVENCSATYNGGAGYLGVWRNCVIRNCRVTSGKIEDQTLFGGNGGGVWGGDLYACVVTNNSAGLFGGGVAGGTSVSGSTVYRCSATDCLIGWNTSGAGGGASGIDMGWLGVPDLETARFCRLANCTVVSNAVKSVDGYVSGNGGGVYRCVLTNCCLEGNVCTRRGGGASRSLLLDTEIRANKSTEGQAWNDDSAGGGASESVLTNCIVVCNESRFIGGGLYACPDVYRTLVATNRLTSAETSGHEITGGAGANASALRECTVENNDSGIVFFGGAMNSCTATVCIVRNNRGPYGGGGYDCHFERCVITNNLAWQRSGGGVYRGTTKNCVIAYNYTTNSVVPEGHKLTGRGAICRGYHEGDLVYSNYYAKGAAVTCGMGDTDITIVNCTVYGNRSIIDESHNGFNLGCATNCIIAGHPNTDVYNCKALVNCFWQEDMVTHGQSDATLAKAVNCIHGRNLDPKFVREPGERQCAFSLAFSSPCLDKGLNFDWMAGAKDVLGNDRLFRHAPIVDIGACECWWRPGTLLMLR